MFAHDFRLIAKLLNQGFERLPVKLPERYLVRVHVLDKTCFTDLICAERLPFVPVLRGVNDDGMGVYLRFLVTVRVVVEFRHNQISGQHRFAFTVRHDTGRGQRLQLPHRFGYRLVVGIDKAFIAAQHRHDRHAFGGREGQVITGPVPVGAVLYPGQVAAIRQLPFQQFRKQRLIHGFPVDPQRLSPLTLPAFVHAPYDVVIILIRIVITGTARRFNGANRHHQKGFVE
ncbi:Uncharacterised protein [Klebsiella pneumoniae]|nr:Uncharacterised protein [Klebsiella pneumoniae]